MKEDDRKNKNQFLKCTDINEGMFQSFIRENCPHMASDDYQLMQLLDEGNYQRIKSITAKYCKFGVKC